MICTKDLDFPGAIIDTRTSDFDGVYYFHAKYRYIKYSIYYDTKDVLGVVGEPYFELAAEDMERYTYKNINGLYKRLRDLFNNHDIEIEKYPERFL